MSKPKAKNLTYQAPDTPSFLRALKAQLSSSSNYGGSKKRNHDLDGFDSLLGVTSAQQAGGQEEDEDDDLTGAQIVVLKDGKHLTKEEAQDARKQQLLESTLSSATTQASQIAQAGSIPSSRRKRTVADSAISAQGKNKSAKAEKKKSGKGLSFSFEDE